MLASGMDSMRRRFSATWDAANPASAHIAEKLGYRPAGDYQVTEIEKT